MHRMLPFDPTAVRVIDLERPRRSSDPIHPGHVPPGYNYLLHRHHEPIPGDARSSAAGVIVQSDHAGTHIDAFAHQAEDLRCYGGRDPREILSGFGFSELGAETIAPIVTRGILIDLVRHRGAPVAAGTLVGLEEVQAAAAAQCVEPQAGDVVLVRTGNGRNWHDAATYLAGPGMAPEVSEWVAGHRVLAAGADNVAWDAQGPRNEGLPFSLPGHVILLVRSGIHILENLDLEELGEAGATEFVLVCLPLKLVGATGSPIRPVALLSTS
ncbi:MAG: cyclase family protein [Candidatus Dormiibacterota bacterium]